MESTQATWNDLNTSILLYPMAVATIPVCTKVLRTRAHMACTHTCLHTYFNGTHTHFYTGTCLLYIPKYSHNHAHTNGFFLFLGNNDRALCISRCKRNRTRAHMACTHTLNLTSHTHTSTQAHACSIYQSTLIITHIQMDAWLIHQLTDQ
jgi:hypothetical protein